MVEIQAMKSWFVLQKQAKFSLWEQSGITFLFSLQPARERLSELSKINGLTHTIFSCLYTLSSFAFYM